MTKFLKLLAVIAVSFSLWSPMPANAQSLTLQQAQTRGLVGERQDGYIGIVKNAPGVDALVDDVNLRRRQLYRDIARKNNIPLNTVERLAADKAINRAPSGEYIQDAIGNWVRKP